jgi:hypothetical protein
VQRDSATTVRGALRILSQDNPDWFGRVDGLLGGVLSGDTGSLDGLLGWLTPRSEALSLVQAALRAVPARLAHSHGLARRELVLAAHTTTVFTAFFDSLRDLHVDHTVIRGWYDEDDSFVWNLYLEAVPTPSAARTFADCVTDVTAWARDRGERICWALSRASPREVTRALLEPEFATDVAAGYRSEYLELAAMIPEFSVWADLAEHEATGTALADLADLLTGTGSKVPTGDSGLVLTIANKAGLDERLVAVPSDDVVVPTVRQSYISPNFRVTTAGPSARLTDDSWWSSDLKSRRNLHLMLGSYLSSAEGVRTPLLVVGGPGTGKSMLTKVLAARLPDIDYIAVRVPLRLVDSRAPVIDQVQQALDLMTHERVSWSQLVIECVNAVGVVLLDGLEDLLQASEGRRNYMAEIAEFQRLQAALGRPVAVLVTSRTSTVDRVRIPAGTPVVKLEDFDNEQIRSWIEIWNLSNASTPRLPTTPEEILAHGELARRPLSLLILALYLTDPAVPEPGTGMSSVELFRRQFYSHTRREVMKSADRVMTEEEVELAVDHSFVYMAVAALGMFNRGRQSITARELRTDLEALMGPGSVNSKPSDLLLRYASSVDGSVEHGYEMWHGTFGEYLIAAFVVRVLTDIVGASGIGRRFREPDDAELFVLLSHQPLALRPLTLTFIVQLAEEMGQEECEAVLSVLDTLIRGYRRRPSTGEFPAYRPTTPDTVRSLAVYSANLVLLRLHVDPVGAVPLEHSWLAEELTNLWKAGLDAEGYSSVLSLVVLDGGVIARRQRHADTAIEAQAGPEPPLVGIEFLHRRLSAGAHAVGQIAWSLNGLMLSAISGGRLAWWSLSGNSSPE